METLEQNGVSPTSKTVEQQLIDLLLPLLESEAVNKMAGHADGYRTLSVELTRSYNANGLEFRVFPGGACRNGIQARSWGDMEKTLLAHDPAAQKQKRIDDLKKELAALQAECQPA